MRVLLVEDELRMAAAIARALRAEGIVADVANTATRGVAMAHGEQYDVLILDVMLPDFDGVEACRRLRRDNVWVPIIMLTARDAIEDRVRGLDQGADDYVTKPFSLAELLARLRALARRGPVPRPVVLEVGALRLAPGTRRAWRGGVEILLSGRAVSRPRTVPRLP